MQDKDPFPPGHIIDLKLYLTRAIDQFGLQKVTETLGDIMYEKNREARDAKR